MSSVQDRCKNELYEITFDEDEDLEKRWTALRSIRNRKIHNPLLGDIDEFISKNSGLVHAVIRKCMTKTKLKVEYEDLYQEGMIGFIKAYCKYDGRAEFSTFAYFHIRNESMKFIRDKLPTFYVPAHIYELSGKVLKRKMEDETPENISKELGCTIKTAINILENLKNLSPTSLNKVIAQADDQPIEIANLIPQEEDYTTSVVKEFLDILTDKQRNTMELILGGLTQTEVGTIKGVSQAQVWKDMKNIRILAKSFFLEEKTS